MENFQLEPSTMNLLLWINGNLPMTRSRFLIAGVLLVAWRPNPDVISCDQPVHWATDLPNMFSGHQWYPESCKIRSSDSKSSHHNAILPESFWRFSNLEIPAHTIANYAIQSPPVMPLLVWDTAIVSVHTTCLADRVWMISFRCF